jgi:enterobactin synthetase component D / holo-[acyl-carrier protein] synthase
VTPPAPGSWPAAAGLFAAILPAGVAAAEILGAGQAVPGGGLFAGERAAVASASPRRRAEFAAGRACARAALAQLGAGAAAILPGPAGEPLWPAGMTGSITHCPGCVASAVAPVTQVAAIGIDAEPDQPLPAAIRQAVAGPAELAAVGPAMVGGRHLFCAKEAVYKAWYSLSGRKLGFRDVAITFTPTEPGATSGAFTARLLVPGPPAGLAGRWLAAAGLIAAAVVVPAGPG